jgi:hypothetical protein
MLPYDRRLSEPMYLNQKTVMDMLYTPYKTNNVPSNTDTTDYTIGNPNMNGLYRNVVYTSFNHPNYVSMFSDESVAFMSDQITRRLKGVHPEGKNIMIPKETILSVADSYWNKNYTNVPLIQEQVIMYIVNSVKTDFGITSNNEKLSAWVMKYSMDTGLKQFNGVKLNENRGAHFYSWNY